MRMSKDAMRKSGMTSMKSYNPCLEPVYGFDNLPANFNHDAVPKMKDEKCNLCLT